MKGNPLRIVGKTCQGHVVLQGVFPVVSSLTGLSLEEVVDILKSKNMVVDWLDFYQDGLKHGWKPDRMMERIRLSVTEVYGKEFGDETITRLKFCINHGELRLNW